VFRNNGSLEEKINELVKILPENSEDRTKLKSVNKICYLKLLNSLQIINKKSWKMY
jgi:hypothetical protein